MLKCPTQVLNVFPPGPCPTAAHTTTDAEFDDVIKTNLYSSFVVLRSSVKGMIRGKGAAGGSIVLCSSAVASHG